MPITIRPMTANDIPLLSAWLVKLPLMQRYGQTLERATTNFKIGLERGDWLLTADSETPACGFAWVIPRGTFGRSPYLRLIGVRADMAGSGIGARLLDAMEARAAEVADDLFLLVSDFNEGAQRFYRRQGYVQIGAIPDYVLPQVSELVFRKRLK
jgi:ribosomal protein S18 acetylase RimI-like enzyme